MKWKGINSYDDWHLFLICHKNMVASSYINSERNAMRLIKLYKARRDNQGLDTDYALLKHQSGYVKKGKKRIPVFDIEKRIDF